MLKLKFQYFGHLCEEPTHWKRVWWWERLRTGGERGNRGWGSWMASPTQWTWVWATLGHPLSPPSPPALNLFQHQGIFQWVSSLHQEAKDWNFSFSISPFNEYSGLISFRIDWFDFLAVQGPLKSLLQHHSLKAPILGHSAFFMVQLSHLYMTTGKTIVLTICFLIPV